MGSPFEAHREIETGRSKLYDEDLLAGVHHCSALGAQNRPRHQGEGASLCWLQENGV